MEPSLSEIVECYQLAMLARVSIEILICDGCRRVRCPRREPLARINLDLER